MVSGDGAGRLRQASTADTAAGGSAWDVCGSSSLDPGLGVLVSVSRVQGSRVVHWAC